MSDQRDDLRAIIFKNRGALLSAPALLLSLFGKPSAFSITVGLPLAFLGEALRCWAVGYSGATTRSDHVQAPKLVTAGPYSYLRNPLYLGNFITAAGFTIAFTGKNTFLTRAALAIATLGTIAGVYSIIIPHEEEFLLRHFGEEFVVYCDHVPPLIPLSEPAEDGAGDYDPDVLLSAESKTFLTFGAMLAVLALKSLKA